MRYPIALAPHPTTPHTAEERSNTLTPMEAVLEAVAANGCLAPEEVVSYVVGVMAEDHNAPVLVEAMVQAVLDGKFAMDDAQMLWRTDRPTYQDPEPGQVPWTKQRTIAVVVQVEDAKGARCLRCGESGCEDAGCCGTWKMGR